MHVMCTAVLIGWDPSHPLALGLIYITWVLLVSKNRRHLFVTPCSTVITELCDKLFLSWKLLEASESLECLISHTNSTQLLYTCRNSTKSFRQWRFCFQCLVCCSKRKNNFVELCGDMLFIFTDAGGIWTIEMLPPVFLWFKERGSFKFTLKTSAIVYEVESSIDSYLYSPFFWQNTFKKQEKQCFGLLWNYFII